MIRAVKYAYINILKRNPKGVNRFDYMDKYVAQHNHAVIKTNIDFEMNNTIPKHVFNQLREEKEQKEETIAFVKSNRYGTFYNFGQDPIMSNDNELVNEIKGKTFWGWMKEALDKKQRTDSHLLAITIIFGASLFLLVNVLIHTQMEMLPHSSNDKISVNP